ncbi:MAG: hypothetical protein GY757_46295 [bacterium]|nr:hypothetical protein [bacterium]
MEWLAGCEKGKVGIWATYHPGQVTQREFLMQCRCLDEMAISYSVGMVGIKEQIPEIRAMRKELPENTYLWVNAYKEIPGYYSKGEVEQLEAVDPLFRNNLEGFKSRGRGCRCGEAVVSIYGDGTVKRCHFEKKIIGNIYSEKIGKLLTEEPCGVDYCGCHIGYVHLKGEDFYELYGDGILERKFFSDRPR